MTPTRLVVSLTGPDAAAGQAQARAAEALGADLLEVRMDLLESLPAALSLFKGRSVPTMATFRGGREERRRALQLAVHAGAAWLDLEEEDLAWRPKGVQVVGSFHDPEGVPGDALARIRRLLSAGADVAKCVGTPRTLAEARALLDLNAAAPGRVSAFGMGPRGVPTRVLAGRFGAWGVYAASDFGPEAADGQLRLSELLFAYRFREITGSTSLYGLLGSPTSQSPGPWAHTAAMRATGGDAVYLPLEASDAADARAALGRFGLKGASVTRPFKEALLDAAGELEEEAERARALNTLFRPRDATAWTGANTDAAGLRRLLGRRKPASVAVIGSGGLARSALVAFPGARVGVLSRRPGVEHAIRREDLASFDVVVQATPVGGVEDPEGMPVPVEVLGKRALLVESPVFPLETPLARAARARGLEVRSGLELWAAQAREQFVLWREREPVQAVLLGAAVARLADLERERGGGGDVVWSLALSGMRGSGKSTVGGLAAGRTARPFRDLDRMVEAELGMPLERYWKEEGEEAFRKVETRALARQRFLPPGVLALGGGAVTREENVRLLATLARTVLLEVPVAELRRRLSEDEGGRPSLTGRGAATELGEVWKAREKAYRASAWRTVDADDAPEAVAGRVLEAFRK